VPKTVFQRPALRTPELESLAVAGATGQLELHPANHRAPQFPITRFLSIDYGRLARDVSFPSSLPLRACSKRAGKPACGDYCFRVKEALLRIGT
jgi:hypothetical protein